MSAAAETGTDFVITRILDAPRTLVFEAWTEPRLMAQWWGPHGFTNPVCELDPRRDGRYRIVMAGCGGEYPLSGVYCEVAEPECLEMTVDCSEHPPEWHGLINAATGLSRQNAPGEVLQTVFFENIDGRTKLTIRMRFESRAIRDAMVGIGMNDGWSQSLERLARLLANSAGD